MVLMFSADLTNYCDDSHVSVLQERLRLFLRSLKFFVFLVP